MNCYVGTKFLALTFVHQTATLHYAIKSDSQKSYSLETVNSFIVATEINPVSVAVADGVNLRNRKATES
jgi:hypothetical protein